jgi:hypothetical protein
MSVSQSLPHESMATSAGAPVASAVAAGPCDAFAQLAAATFAG